MAELHQILSEIADGEPIEALAITLRERPGAHVHVAPALSAARPAIVAALALHAAPLLYVVTNGDAAQRAASDLCEWLGEDAVLQFPANDALPYEQMSPGAAVIAARLRVLKTLNDQGRTLNNTQQAAAAHHAQRSTFSAQRSSADPRPLVIVAPVKALLQPTLARADWQQATTVLKQGQEHSPDELMRRWTELGYRVAPTVEEPGEINRRGGIIDIFPPGDDQPLRIEFFGDEVDSMRRFDPLSQRSEQRVQLAVIGPPHEIALWRLDEALARLDALPADRLRPEARDEWEAARERLANGERFEGRAFYAPFFRAPGPAPSLLSYMPPGAAMLLSDGLLLAQHAAELDHQSEERRALHVEAGELPATFPRPYLRWDELLAQGDQLSLVNVSNNEAPGDLRGIGSDGREQQALASPIFTPANLFGGQLRALVDDIVERLKNGERVVAVTPQAARIQELVEERLQESGVGGQGSEEGGPGEGETGSRGDKEKGRQGDRDSSAFSLQPSAFSSQPSAFFAVHGSLDGGWRAPALNLTLYSDAEIFGWRQRRAVAERGRSRDRGAEERAAFLRGLKVGDYVVHIEHGIAQYDGLVRRSVGGIERDYLNLRYAEGDRLYVPVDQIDRVSRYIGAGDAAPQLTRLGTQEWERAKRKARAAVQDLADDLLQIYAQRQLSEGFAYSPDNEWQRELEDAFPYVETDDQVRAIEAVKADMEQPQPMDRLVCGDVGFGKTEVALRAAFKAVQDGKQVAVLVPTTVLAQQHFETFSRRMATFPLKIEMLSRLRSPAEQEQILQRLARGELDMVVGTHRLLSKDVHFKDLGLLVVDEEQRFGVRHKERIKQLRANVDVLTLTATPIPRTLHMAMAGIRDMSVIDTPPEDRVPIKTYVLPHDDKLVREAMLRELDRGGQVFFVHNRVQSIYYVADKLKRLVPEASFLVGHGQLEERQLEKVMLEFFSGKADVLVCTTIIESGLDVPNANTIIIDDAVNYGLAQLYQLRGRVGRSTQRAYAYLFYPSDRRITDEAHERLLAIQEATELGAGLRIAMRDLEIRGAGNLLGAEQSGHIAAVGFDLYTRLLEQAVSTLKKQFHAGQTKDERRKTKDDSSVADGDGAGAADHKRPSSVLRPSSRVKVDEKVLVAPLVTLDLPLDAFIPPDYIPDDRVRLSVYQRLAEAQTPARVRELRTELRDRFGEPPDPAECLLTWLMIKALALQAGVGSIVTTDEEFIVRLPEGGAAERERLRQRFKHDGAVKVGPQFVRLDRRSVKDEWIPALTGILDTIGKQHQEQHALIEAQRSAPR